MAVTTYLRQSGISRTYPYHLKDLELADLLQELREETHDDWVILEESFGERYWFRKTVRKTYRLLKCLDGAEYQDIQFYRPGEDPVMTIGTGVPASVVAAYILGLLAGRTREAIASCP
jgi:hypothetical protein